MFPQQSPGSRAIELVLTETTLASVHQTGQVLLYDITAKPALLATWGGFYSERALASASVWMNGMFYTLFSTGMLYIYSSERVQQVELFEMETRDVFCKRESVVCIACSDDILVAGCEEGIAVVNASLGVSFIACECVGVSIVGSMIVAATREAVQVYALDGRCVGEFSVELHGSVRISGTGLVCKKEDGSVDRYTMKSIPRVLSTHTSSHTLRTRLWTVPLAMLENTVLRRDAVMLASLIKDASKHACNIALAQGFSFVTQSCMRACCTGTQAHSTRPRVCLQIRGSRD